MPAGTEEKITFLAKEVIKAPVLQTLCELINPVMRSGDKLKMFYSKSMYRAKSRIPIADRAWRQVVSVTEIHFLGFLSQEYPAVTETVVENHA